MPTGVNSENANHTHWFVLNVVSVMMTEWHRTAVAFCSPYAHAMVEIRPFSSALNHMSAPPVLRLVRNRWASLKAASSRSLCLSMMVRTCRDMHHPAEDTIQCESIVRLQWLKRPPPAFTSIPTELDKEL